MPETKMLDASNLLPSRLPVWYNCKYPIKMFCLLQETKSHNIPNGHWAVLHFFTQYIKVKFFRGWETNNIFYVRLTTESPTDAESICQGVREHSALGETNMDCIY